MSGQKEGKRYLLIPGIDNCVYHNCTCEVLVSRIEWCGASTSLFLLLISDVGLFTQLRVKPPGEMAPLPNPRTPSHIKHSSSRGAVMRRLCNKDRRGGNFLTFQIISSFRSQYSTKEARGATHFLLYDEYDPSYTSQLVLSSTVLDGDHRFGRNHHKACQSLPIGKSIT